jgi:endonuclease/exonuclease/phosphatase family metal-dependent hydrolase
MHVELYGPSDDRDSANPGPAEKLSAAGFCSAVPSARTPTTAARHLLESGRHIDWAFIRGPLQPDKGRVHTGVKASDHYPISFNLEK